MKKLLVFLLVFAMMAAMLVGCSEGGDTPAKDPKNLLNSIRRSAIST